MTYTPASIHWFTSWATVRNQSDHDASPRNTVSFPSLVLWMLGDCLHRELVQPPECILHIHADPTLEIRGLAPRAIVAATMLFQLGHPLLSTRTFPEELLGLWNVSPLCTSVVSATTRAKTPPHWHPLGLRPVKKLTAIASLSQASCRWGVQCHCSTCNLGCETQRLEVNTHLHGPSNCLVVVPTAVLECA